MTKLGVTFGVSHHAPPPLRRRLLTPKDLPEKGIHYHLNHLRRLWMRGDFPKPSRISERRLAWDEATIDAWIEAKLAAGA